VVTLADSSVWIDYFNGVESEQVEALDALGDSEGLLVGDLVLLEVLRGFRLDRDHAEAQATMLMYPVVSLLGSRDAVVAARRYRRLRKRGITIRKIADVVIASYCITNAVALLYNDRDFDPFVDHFGLERA
jgi:predicted nucleic acid-binding protein